MKLSITSFLLATATTFAYTEGLPSLLQPREEAIIARERLLLRPAWRPSTPTFPSSSGPLRRGRRAEESKIAFRHNSGRRQNAAAAVPIHINYAERAVNMPFPLAMQIKRDASEKEQDPDQEDDWECEDEEDGDSQDASSQQPAESASQSTYVPVPTSDNGRSNPKITADQSSDSASSDASAPLQGASPDASSPSSNDSTSIQNATGSAPLSDPSNLAAGSTTVAQGCTRFHTILAGEVCLGLLDGGRDIGLTLDQLYSYNPSINGQCSNLEIGQALCTGKA